MNRQVGPAPGILIVEDEFIVAAFIERALKLAGYEVIGPYCTAGAALDAIGKRSATIDAAILDVSLGHGETTHPIARDLRALGIPHLFLTGEDTGPDQPDAATGAPPVLIKPVRLSLLLDVLGNLVGARYPS